MQNTDKGRDLNIRRNTSPLNLPTDRNNPKKKLATAQDDPPMTRNLANTYSPEKKRPVGEVVFNVAGTKYSVVKSVGKDIFNWTLSNDPQKEWDIAWLDYISDYSIFSNVKPFQKVSFFPGIKCLARKDQLGLNLMRLKKKFPKEYDFFPETFILPCDFEEFRAHIHKGKQQNVYIVKPNAGCQGKGIFLTKTTAEIDRGMYYVAQKYLTDPYLIEGLKFDMRIYVLLASCDPLKIYLYDDGLTRFATEPYKDPTHENLTDVCMHLTNYAINKNNPNFVFNNSAAHHDFGHKRSIKALFKILKRQGQDVTRLWNEIKKIIIKTFCSAQSILAHTYKSYNACSKNLPVSNCFQIFGFDIILDKNLKPWLLEVNQSPSWTTDTPLDKTIKENVIKDALNLLNISAKDRMNYKKKLREQIESRSISGKISKPSEEQIKAEYQRKQDELDTLEAITNTGGYEKIFPIKESTEGADEENYNAFLVAVKEILPFRETSSMYKFLTSGDGDNLTSPRLSPSKTPAMLNKHKKQQLSHQQRKSESNTNHKKVKGQGTPKTQSGANNYMKNIEIEDLEGQNNVGDPSQQGVNNKKDELNKKKKGNSKKTIHDNKPGINIEDFNDLLEENVIPASSGPSTKSIEKIEKIEKRSVANNTKFPFSNTLPRQLAESIFERLATGKKHFAKISLHIPSNPSDAVHIDISNSHKMSLEKKLKEQNNSSIPKRFTQDSLSRDFAKALASNQTFKSAHGSIAVDGAMEQDLKSTASPTSITPKAKKPAPSIEKEHQSYGKIIFGRENINRPSTAQFGNYLMPKRFENTTSPTKPRGVIDLSAEKNSWQKGSSIEAESPMPAEPLLKPAKIAQNNFKKLDNKH